MEHVWTQQELKKQLFQDIIGYLHKGKVSLHSSAPQVKTPPRQSQPVCGDISGWRRLTPAAVSYVPVLCLLFTQMWEKAIELGKQLAKMHESHMFDFMELSQLLVRSPAHQTTPGWSPHRYRSTAPKI